MSLRNSWNLGSAYPVSAFILLHFVLRLVVAQFSNLGVDEVYYTLYAEHLDWAYFDHPPMVGWLIWLTTAGGFLDTDLFLRLSALITGSINLFLLYAIGRRLHSDLCGWLAVVFGAASFYTAIISGVFILPDTPLTTGWLAGLYFFVRYNQSHGNKWLLWMGIAIGFAMLSKYIAVFAWGGAGLYWLFKDVKVLKNPFLWGSIGISAVMFLPVFLWNLNSEYSGLNYHADRVGGSIWPSLRHFFPNFFGQIFYNNPVNVVLIVIAIFSLFRSPLWFKNSRFFALLCWGLPLVFITLIMALYNQTLPHWSGPAYYSLLLLAIIYFIEKKPVKWLRKAAVASTVLYMLVIFIGLLQINYAILPLSTTQEPTQLGKTDFTSDLSAWSQAYKTTDENLTPNIPIITAKWFPAAHIQRYVAKENPVYVYGERNDQHHYLVIHQEQPPILAGQDAYYITTSQYYREPPQDLVMQFESMSESQIIPLTRNQIVRNNLFVWQLHKAKANVSMHP
ncbi:MAG: glycosyltransferase family 39 protein [Weeksellaceae bacterium]|nr:glycosyltransferase family 39 protein [Weeksellaceae bacterium]